MALYLMQRNSIRIPAAVAAAYDVAEGKPPFDYVFDFTGEVRHDRNEAVSRKM